jgi:hypothetical protein
MVERSQTPEGTGELLYQIKKHPEKECKSFLKSIDKKPIVWYHKGVGATRNGRTSPAQIKDNRAMVEWRGYLFLLFK